MTGIRQLACHPAHRLREDSGTGPRTYDRLAHEAAIRTQQCLAGMAPYQIWLSWRP